MRTIIFVIISSLLSTILYGQKNTVLVYGSFDHTSSDYTSEKIKSLLFNLGVGYQFDSQWTAGLTFTTGSQRQDGQQSNIYRNTNLSIGPFIRYSIHSTSLFLIYGQIEGGYSSIKYHQSQTQTTEAKTNGYFINLFPAVFINIKNNFGLNFNIGGVSYQSTKFKGVENNNKLFSLTLGKSVGIGISKNF